MSSIIFVLLLIKSAGEICEVAGTAEDLENGFILDKNDCFGWETTGDVELWGIVIDGADVAVVVELWGTVIDGAISDDSGLFLNILLKNDCFGCVFCAIGTVICGE